MATDESKLLPAENAPVVVRVARNVTRVFVYTVKSSSGDGTPVATWFQR